LSLSRAKAVPTGHQAHVRREETAAFAAGAEAQLAGSLAVCLVGADIIDVLGRPGCAAPTMPPALAAFRAALHTVLWPPSGGPCRGPGLRHLLLVGDGYALRTASTLAT